MGNASRGTAWVNSQDCPGKAAQEQEQGKDGEGFLQTFQNGLNLVGADQAIAHVDFQRFVPHLSIVPAGFFVKNSGIRQAGVDIGPAQIQTHQRQTKEQTCTRRTDQKELERMFCRSETGSSNGT